MQSKLFEELLLDPARTGNRSSGWHFARASERPRLAQGKVSWQGRGAFEVEVHDDGALLFQIRLSALHWKGEEMELYEVAFMAGRPELSFCKPISGKGL